MLLFLGVAGSVSAAPVEDLREDWLFTELFAHEGLRYADFRSGQDVPAILAVEEGAREAVEARVMAAGGRIAQREPAIGYLEIVVPLRAWPQVRTLPGVVAAALDGRLGFPGWTSSEPRPRPRGFPFPPVDEARVAGLAGSQVLANAGSGPTGSLLQQALGLGPWWRARPSFDGRGVGIAIIEPNSEAIAFDHPAFRSALDADGRIRPKIADVVIVRPTWQRVSALETFTAENGLTWTGEGWVRPPRAGTFHFGRAELPSGLSLFLLWDARDGEVRIDTNGDFDFSNDPPLRDIRAADPGYVAVAAGQRLRVRLSDDRRSLLLLFSGAGHASHSASVASASPMPVPGIASGMSGTAPGAQLILVGFGDDTGSSTTVSTLVEALLLAARHPQVDVISLSMASIDGWPAAGRDVVAVLARRIALAHAKPIVMAAGNGGEFGRAAALGGAALHVGAFMPAAIARRNLGTSDLADSISFFTSGGPRMDGGAAPDVIGPVQDIAATPCRVPRPRNPERPRILDLPPCYELYGGTSAAAPAVAGFVASLISGLKQQHLPLPRPEVLYAAVRASARPLPGVPVSLQGAGVPQADIAWRLLSGPVAALDVETRAPIDHALVDYLPAGDEGVGLYERDGWTAGETGRRSLAIRRDTGPAVMVHRLSLQGDTAFTVPRSLVTRRGVEAAIPVTIRARRSGIHSARLLLEDPSGRTATIERRLTIVAADDLPVPGAGTPDEGRTYGGVLAPLGYRDIAVRVPEGTAALRLELEAAEEVSLWFQEPAGWIYHRDNLAGLAEFKRAQSSARALWIPQPAAGTWTFRLFRGGAEEFAIVNAERPYQLRIAAVDLSPSLRVSADGFSRTLRVAVSGPAAVAIQPMLARTVRSDHSTDAARGLPLLIPFQVDEGVALAQWHLTTSGTAAEERVHAYLYDCSRGYCLMRDAGVPAAARYLASVDDPTPGRWVVAVTPGPHATGTLRFNVDFSQVRTQPAGQTSPAGAPVRVTAQAPYLDEFRHSCAGSGRSASILLRLMPDAGQPAPIRSATGAISPTLPPVQLCPASEGDPGPGG